MKIGIITGGGDCPGLNAVIRAVTKKALFEHKMEIIGFEDGFDGLIQNRYKNLNYTDVSGILTLGGTMLGTSNKTNPYKYYVNGQSEPMDVSRQVIKNIQDHKIDCLICIGGDGTFSIANKLVNDGIPVVGIPKTIDNDIIGTEVTFGFNTAVEVATWGIDRIHTTAEAHHRIMIIEVMGRSAGWIALFSGIAGGGDIILIPEIEYEIGYIIKKIEERKSQGKHFSIIVVAEGAKERGHSAVVKKIVKDTAEPVRLGGISFILSEQIEEMSGIESRAVVMGHLLRGGSPTAYDRILATQLGTRAVDMIIEKKFGNMIGVQSNALVDIPFERVAKGARLVPLDHTMIKSALSLGTSFGSDR